MKNLKQKIKDSLGEKKVEKLKKSLGVARIVKNVLCWTLVAILAMAIVVFMITKLSGGTPKLFGYTINRIVSGSMSPELEIGDVIISKVVTDTDEVHVNDIVTFQGGVDFENQKVTHRVLVSPYSASNGQIVIVTKGDANEIDDGEIVFDDVESKYISKVDILKSVYNFFFSKWGLIIFIFLLLLIFFDEIMNIIKLIVSGREEEEPETLSQIMVRIKQEQQENLEPNELPSGKADSAGEEPSSEDKDKEIETEKRSSQKSDPGKKAAVKKIKKDTEKNSNANKKKGSNNQSTNQKKKKKKSKKRKKR